MKDLDGLKQQHPLDQVVARLTKQTPEAHKIRCPFHADDSPSLHVYDDASWHCFGCGKGGDVIDFAGFFYFGATYDPASHFLEVIDRLGGLGIEPIRPNERPLAPRPPAPTTVFDFDRIAYWHDAMPPSRRDYWHSRGLHDETIDRFRLGWDGWRYTIPVTFRGVCYGIKRRRSEIDDGLEGKYVMQKGSRVGIFNADILSTPFDSDLPLFVVEGEIEAMLLDQLGYQAISSTGGANTWKAHWSSFLAAVPRIVILYDNDEPGRQGALLVRSLIRRAHIWHWPDFAHDGGEFLPTDGAWDWLNAQIHSTPYQLPTNSVPTPD